MLYRDKGKKMETSVMGLYRVWGLGFRALLLLVKHLSGRTCGSLEVAIRCQHQHLPSLSTRRPNQIQSSHFGRKSQKRAVRKRHEEIRNRRRSSTGILNTGLARSLTDFHAGSKNIARGLNQLVASMAADVPAVTSPLCTQNNTFLS